jgi:lipopolysaccharide export system permease protein
VFFADARAADASRSLTDVFFHQVADGNLSLITARRAVEQSDPAQRERFIRLYDGFQYEFPRVGRYEVTAFRELAIYLPRKAEETELGTAKERSGWELFTSSVAADRAEFQWRLAMPVSTLLLVLAALPLARVDDRRDRYARVFVSLLLYVAYRLLLGVAKNWVADGVLPAFPGLWTIHLGCLLLGVAMLQLSVRDPMFSRALAIRFSSLVRR